MDHFYFPEWLPSSLLRKISEMACLFEKKDQKMNRWFKHRGWWLSHRNTQDARVGSTEVDSSKNFSQIITTEPVELLLPINNLEHCLNCCFCCQHQTIDIFASGKWTWIIQLPLPKECILHSSYIFKSLTPSSLSEMGASDGGKSCDISIA